MSGHAATRGFSPGRGAAIRAIKAVHSVIFLVNAVAVVHIFWAGLAGGRSRWTRPALVAALGETAVFVANRGRCPLTDLVERLGAENGRVSDIFLPRWFADRIPQIFGPQLAVGLGLLAWRRWRRCAGTRAGGAWHRRRPAVGPGVPPAQRAWRASERSWSWCTR